MGQIRTLIKDRLNIFLLISIMGISLLLMLYYGSHKKYMYIDEVLSYTAANNAEGLFYDFQPDTWHQGTDFVDPLTVKTGHRFDYTMVWRNQASDTHPPVYHAILHTICSIFPRVFSKWFALSINIVSLLLIEIIVYKISLLLFTNNKWMPLICVTAYAGSIAVITQVMFLRMYMVLQIFTSLALLLHIKGIQSKVKNSFFFLQLFGITLLGTLTQYYYLIFAFFLAIYFCIYLLANRKIKMLIEYTVTMIGSLFVSLLIFPSIPKHLFGGEVGTSAVNNILSFNHIKERLVTIYAMLNIEVFGSNFKLLLFIVFLFVIVKIVKRHFTYDSLKIEMKQMFENLSVGVGILLFVIVTYYLLVSLITPYLCDRYFSPIFIPLLLVLIKVLHLIFNELFKSESIMYIVMLAVLLNPMYSQLKKGLTDTNKQEMLRLASENRETICLIEPDIYMENFMELGMYKQVFVTNLHDGLLSNPQIEKVSSFLVYLPDDVNIEDYCEMVQNQSSASYCYERLYVAYRATVYRLYM